MRLELKAIWWRNDFIILRRSILLRGNSKSLLKHRRLFHFHVFRFIQFFSLRHHQICLEQTQTVMRPPLIHAFYLLGLIPLSYQSAIAQTSEKELKLEKQIIEATNKAYFNAIEKKDMHAFIRQYTDDCWIMTPNVPVYCGPEAPRDYFNEVMLMKGISRGKFITIDLYGVQNDVMAEVGFYQLYNQSGTQFDDGKYVMLWKKTDGHWKRLRETLISSRPANQDPLQTSKTQQTK